MSIKIQINSLEALERLIGGDSQIEVEIRGNIIHEFTKQHLKPLLAEEHFRVTIEALRREVIEQTRHAAEMQIATFKQSFLGGQPYDIRLNESIKSHIATTARASVLNLVANITDKAVEDMRADMDKVVQNRMENVTKTYIDDAIRKRIAEVMR